MNTYLITLSNYLYKDSRDRLVRSALANKIVNVKAFDFEEIKQTKFYKENESIMSNDKFMGYWLWKPYIILETIKQLNDNDILIYVDAGIEIIDKLDILVKKCQIESDIIVCGNANDLNSAWTKRDCFVLMDCDSARFWYASHCDASFMMFKKTAISIDFITQWLEYGSNINIISDAPNICDLPNLPDYVDHRYDQSILSILAEKFQLQLYRVASQFGNHYKMHSLRIEDEFNCINQMNQQQLSHYYFLPYYNSPYGQLLNHHRKKNIVQQMNSKQSINYKTKIFIKIKQYLKKILHILKV